MIAIFSSSITYELYETPSGTTYWLSNKSIVVSSTPMYLTDSDIFIMSVSPFNVKLLITLLLIKQSLL